MGLNKAPVPTPDTNLDRIKSDLMRDEGEVLHAYQDSLGYWTIGVGILIDARRGGGITHDESMILLAHRIDKTIAGLRQHIAFFNTLNAARQRALVNMAYQMGVDGVLEFSHMLSALERADWRAAHDEALASDWARRTPHRADRVATLLLRGQSN